MSFSCDQELRVYGESGPGEAEGVWEVCVVEREDVGGWGVWGVKQEGKRGGLQECI